MQVLNFFLLLIILGVIFSLKSKVTELQETVRKLSKKTVVKPDVTVKTSRATQTMDSPAPKVSLSKPKETPIKPEEVKPIASLRKEGPTPINKPSSSQQTTSEERKKYGISQAHVQQKPKEKKPSFMERNPDLEKFIGENLLSKIGIVVFVIGMGFLVKLGIDNDVITEPLRVAIGVLIGGALIGIGHYLRKSFTTFSSILIGGALSVLYFTIALAFHEYQLIPQTGAFIIMVCITAFAVLLSLSYNRKELAVLAVLGGFGTPFFISTGSGNVAVLLTYILILDIGMLALVFFKKWNIINNLCYALTYLLFIGVYSTKFVDNPDQLRFTLLFFLTCFYLTFLTMHLVYNLKNRQKFETMEMLSLLSNTGVYFGFGILIISGYKDGMYNGLFTTLLAGLNLCITLVLFKRKDIDTNLLYLLIGLVLTFVSLIAPIQLQGHSITLFWATESVLLLWLFNKSKIDLIKLASLLITALMLISLVMDWYINYESSSESLNIVLNKAFITSVVALCALFIQSKWLKGNEIFKPLDVKITWKSQFNQVTFGVVLYLTLLLELQYQLKAYGLQNTYQTIIIGIYHFVWIINLLLIEKNFRIKQLHPFNLFFSLAAIVSFLSKIGYAIITARNNYLVHQEVENTGFFSHYILLALLLYILMLCSQSFFKKYPVRSAEGKSAIWVLCITVVILASMEFSHLYMLVKYHDNTTLHNLQNIVVRSIYPIVWGLTAFTFMIIGMKKKIKTLRIVSLSLFSLTLVKLFVYDLAGNSTGKIISFTVLGAILLVISFLYQKLKFIIQDDEQKEV